MPVLTRFPAVARPEVELPDPTQPLALLRVVLRIRIAQSLLGGGLGLALVLGVCALAGGLDGDEDFLTPGLCGGLGPAIVDWWVLRAQVRRADPMVEPVALLRPRLSFGRMDLLTDALIWALITVATVLIGWDLFAVGLAVGVLARGLVLEAWLFVRERRDRLRYLQRVDLPDDDLLHATPEAVRRLESGHG